MKVSYDYEYYETETPRVLDHIEDLIRNDIFCWSKHENELVGMWLSEVETDQLIDTIDFDKMKHDLADQFTFNKGIERFYLDLKKLALPFLKNMYDVAKLKLETEAEAALKPANMSWDEYHTGIPAQGAI